MDTRVSKSDREEMISFEWSSRIPHNRIRCRKV